MMRRILVTGGTGFVGRAVTTELMKRRYSVRACGRQQLSSNDAGLDYVRGPDLSATADWTAILRDMDAVVHCGARVHVMSESAEVPLAAFRAVNTAGTLNLARQCVEAGVKRFLFISSVKVNGEVTDSGQEFCESDVPYPSDPYGVSKLEAELGLREIAERSAMEVVIIRPPLVYGPGVGANFAALMGAVHRGIPLPLGAVRNRRSLVALDNLVDFAALCLEHPAAGNEIFLISDGDDLSTPELIRGMARALDVPPRLLPVPLTVLRACAGVFGRGDALRRLCGNLQVDIAKARSMLGWLPPASVEEGLSRAAVGWGNR